MNAELEPQIVKAGSGWRWLAVAPKGAVCSIAVFGNSKDEALDNYRKRMEMWASALSTHP